MKTFKQIVSERLEELGTNAFAAEKKGNLKKDTIRSVVRPDSRNSTPKVDTAERICRALDLEFYIGPRRNSVVAGKQIGPEFTQIPRFDAELSAGPGVVNESNLPPSTLAFRRDWLAKMRINPTKCVIVSVAGDSMEPTLYDGDLVMLDRQATTVRDMRLFGVVDVDGTAKVKRLQKFEHELIMHSDNRTYPSSVRSSADANRMTVIGQVVWSGHDFER